MSSILILSRSLVASDPRVRRQIDALSGEHALTVAAYGPCPYPDLGFIEWTRFVAAGRGIFGKLGKLVRGGTRPGAIFRSFALRALAALPKGVRESVVWRMAMRWAAGLGAADMSIVRALHGQRFDLVIANDLSALGTGAALKGNGRLLYDAHEYHPGHQPDSPAWRRYGKPVALATLERFLPYCNAVTTVCDGIAYAFQADFGIPLPVVITNTPPYRTLDPVENAEGPIRLVHHGLASRKRGFDTMIDALALLGEGYYLDLYLSDGGSAKARGYIAELTASLAGNDRVRILPAMPMPEIPERINGYDIGLAFFPPRTFNLLHALPNKFFEYVQARLAVIAGPSPDMAHLIERHGLGAVAKGFEAADLAAAIASMDRGTIVRYKRAADIAARELAAEPQIEKLRALVRSLVNASLPATGKSS